MTVVLPLHVKAVTLPPGVEIRIRTTPLSAEELAELTANLRRDIRSPRSARPAANQ